MAKQVGSVSSQNFGFLYIDGLPYNISKVKRFMNKGAGIKNGDIVIFDFDMIDDFRTISYIKNAIYKDGTEIRLVKAYVEASEMRRANMADFDGVSAAIKKELAEEGIVITNDGVFLTPATECELTKPEMKELMEGQGKVISVSFGATINLGNFTNVKLDVTATDYETARNEFLKRSEEAVDSIRGVMQNL